MSNKHLAGPEKETSTSPATAPIPLTGANAAPADQLELLSADGTLQESEEDMEARVAMEGLMRHRKAQTRKKLFVGGVIGGVAVVAAIVAGVSYLGSSSSSADASAPMTTMVEKGDFSEAVTASGSAQPVESVVVSPGVDGTIESVNIAEGDTVNEGDVIMTLTNSDLDKKITEAANGVRDAKSGVAEATDAYNALVDKYNKAIESDAKAWEIWNQEKANFYADEENAGKSYTTAEPESSAPTDSEFQSAERNIEKAKNTLADAQATYNEAVETADKRTVRAPKSGSVVVMNAQVGASITSGGTSGGTSSASSESGSGALIQIADLSQMMVKVNVNEVDISKVSVGQAATVTFTALPNVVADATVTRIATVSSTSGSSSGSGSSGAATYEVSLLIPNPAEGLKPGMTANVSIQIQSVPDTLIVPVSSVGTAADGSSYVTVVKGTEEKTYEQRAVTVVASDKANAAIQGSVAEGDAILLSPDAAAGEAANASGAEGATGYVDSADGTTTYVDSDGTEHVESATVSGS